MNFHESNRQAESNQQPTPFFLYGTAWKEEQTAQLTQRALQAGFRGIDTANQRKHYAEEAVGHALLYAYEHLELSRSDLWLQTKFTHLAGQDHRLPYDPRAPIREQVMSSFESSLAHLHTEVLNAFILHGPSLRHGLADEDWEVWAAMEELYMQGKIKAIGVSNVSAAQLQLLLGECKIKPRYVQNRCFASQGWDRDIRQVCNHHQIIYQGFSLLTANREVWESAAITQISQHHKCTRAEVVFSFALALNMLPLTGTSNPQHMHNDLRSRADMLSEQELMFIKNIYPQK